MTFENINLEEAKRDFLENVGFQDKFRESDKEWRHILGKILEGQKLRNN